MASRKSNSERILIYVASLPVSLILFGAVWAFVAPRLLYHCWDDAPPFFISWMPPFIHPEFNSSDGVLRDFYRAPKWVVYSAWLSFIGGVFLLPAYLAMRGWQNKTPEAV